MIAIFHTMKTTYNNLLINSGMVRRFIMVLVAAYFFMSNNTGICGQEKTLIFPIPQELEKNGERFVLNEEVLILIPQHATESDLILARFLVREFSDKYGIALNIKHVSNIPDDDGRYIIMGVIDNPLVNSYCKQKGIEITRESPGKEGYVLEVNKNKAIVAGWDESGAFYGLQSLRQLVHEADGFELVGVHVRDWPSTPFRGIRLYIPGPEHISFFKRFLRDFMALYKFNKVIICGFHSMEDCDHLLRISNNLSRMAS